MGIQYLYIRHSNLYLLALTKRNTNATEILLFLHKIVEVFTEYFKELEEESIRDNFVIIYELLDEMMDFGYPQTTESKILQESVPLLHLPSSPSTIGERTYRGEGQLAKKKKKKRNTKLDIANYIAFVRGKTDT